jgi:hypothetical protein
VPKDGRCGFNKRFPGIRIFPKMPKKSITTHIPSYLHISQLWALQRAIHKLASYQSICTFPTVGSSERQKRNPICPLPALFFSPVQTSDWPDFFQTSLLIDITTSASTLTRFSNLEDGGSNSFRNVRIHIYHTA